MPPASTSQILDAIIDGDESLAASATQLHLRNSLRTISSTDHEGPTQ